MNRRLAPWVMLAAALACRSGREDASAPAEPARAATTAAPAPDPVQAQPTKDSAHHVVFADRTSQGYLLLLPGKQRPKTPARDELRALAKQRLGADEPEVDLLLELIGMEPRGRRDPVTDELGESDLERASRRANDLLGLHIEVLELRSKTDQAVIPAEAFTDPILTRELQPAELASIDDRKFALLLRADYRNQHAVRGLRLLQTLVRVVADEHGALIHDPDTRETLSLEAFSRRRLQASLGNVADQVAVVPFADPKHGEGHVRLATRGMRRFGSVDLELDGLPADPELLQQATHLIYGLALRMVRLGEVDPSGFAVEVGETVKIHYGDISQAYSTRMVKVPRCRGCPEEVVVHLVEREREPHDPRDHVVARIVAPRSISSVPGHDHRAWAVQAVAKVLGPPAP